MARTYQLYRHFDKTGALLYVGLSLSVFSRTLTHRNKTRWFIDIATITVEHMADRTEAMAAEHKAINTENPKYNVRRDENSYPEFLVARMLGEPTTKAKRRGVAKLNASDDGGAHV
jgi:excinuclease UvrABC nuclease subunit